MWLAHVDCLEKKKKNKSYSETLSVCVEFLYMLCLYNKKKKKKHFLREDETPGFYVICGLGQEKLKKAMCTFKY